MAPWRAARPRAARSLWRRSCSRAPGAGRRRSIAASSSIGLLLAFAVSLGVFTATYDQQAKVDAQLTLGADVTVSSPPGVAAPADLACEGRVGPRGSGDDRRRPLLRLRRAGPPGHLRHRPGDASPNATTPARLLLPRRQRASQMMSRLASTPRRDPRLAGDDHRLLAASRATCSGCACSTSAPAGSGSRRSMSSAPSRSSPRRRGTPSWSRTSPTSSGSRTPGPNVVFAKTSGEPAGGRRAHRRGHGAAAAPR